MRNKSKIGIIIQTRLEDGGIHHYGEAMVNSFVDLEMSGCEFVLFLSKDDKRFENMSCAKRILNCNEGRKKLLSYIAMSLGIRTSLLLNTQTKKQFSDIDALLIPNILYYPVYALSIPFAMTIHDLQERNFPHFFSWREKVKRGFVNRVLSKIASVLICESDSIQNDIETYLKVCHEKVLVLPERLRPAMYKAPLEKHSVQEEPEFELKRDFLLYPAQFWPHKNHLLLLEAMSTIKEPIDLVLVGHKEDGIKKVQSKASELNMLDRTHFLGFVSDSMLIQLYKKATLVVVPSLYESISLPVEEAKTNNTAVCCSNFLGKLHKIPKQMCFDPTDKMNMQSVIANALNNPQKSDAEEIVDKEKHQKSLKAIIEKLLEK